MRRVRRLTEVSAARLKARAREEAKKELSNMKIFFGDTEEGIIFRAAQEVVYEEHGDNGAGWVNLLLYQYGIERGAKKKQSHPKKLKLSAI